MRIIISPAKKMKVDSEFAENLTAPEFLEEAKKIKLALKDKSFEELKDLWGCNENIANLNFKRLNDMNLSKGQTPAILAYEGIQYTYMAPSIFEDGHFDYVSKHLRILSGFYGLLRPFDGVVPYRLEMQSKLAVGDYKTLYGFWNDKLAKSLVKETDLVLNLASKEYSKIISDNLPKNTRMLTCIFGELRDNKVVEKGTFCKMARGQMVRYLAEHKITQSQEIKGFNELEYAYSKEFSSEERYVFLKEGK